MKQKNLLTRMLLLFALVVGSVTSVWAEDVIVATFDSDQLVTNSTYANTYGGDNWSISMGGNNKSIGFNNSNCVTIGNALGTGATATNYGVVVKSKNKLSNINKITFLYTGGSGDGGKLYLAYSLDGENWQAITLKSGTGLSAQGVTPSQNTTFTFEFNEIVSAYYGIVLDKGNTSKNAYRFDNVVINFINSTAGSPLSSIALSGDYTRTFSQGTTFNHDGLVVTATYADNSTKDVTSSATFSTPDMSTTGIKEVTVSYTEGEVTKTATYDITVTEYVQPINITIRDWSALFGVASDAGDKVTKQDYSGEIDRVTVVYKKATNMYIKTSDLRIYNGSVLTFTAPTGYYLTKVVFEGTSSSEKAPSADVGTFNYSTMTWTGFANSFTLSRNSGSGYTKFSKATITLVKVISTSIASSGYSTLSNDNDLDFANAVAENETADALVAYIIPSNDGAKLTISTVTEAPAGTGILLKGTPSVTYTIPVKTNAASVGTNLLKAGPVTVPEGNQTIYLLSGGQFHIAAAGTTSVGKAYLELPAAVGAPALSIDNDDETTGIGMTTVNGQQTTDGVYYDLSGRRVAQPTKGLYIVNGKKIVIK